MGNRAEEDYNFVFKGELGSIKRETVRTREHPSCLFTCYQDCPRIHHSFGEESKLQGVGEGLVTGAKVLELPECSTPADNDVDHSPVGPS